jgi:hypothetical protein
MTDVQYWKSLLAIEVEKKKQLEAQLKAVKSYIRNLQFEIDKFTIDYYVKIDGSDFRHAFDETHSPYMGYGVTMRGEIVKDYTVSYDDTSPICPDCEFEVQARGVNQTRIENDETL